MKKWNGVFVHGRNKIEKTENRVREEYFLILETIALWPGICTLLNNNKRTSSSRFEADRQRRLIMLATLIQTAGRHRQASVELAGRLLCVRDEFSDGPYDAGKAYDFHFCSPRAAQNTKNAQPSSKKMLSNTGGWSYTAIGEICWNDYGGVEVDCDTVRLIHPSFLSPAPLANNKFCDLISFGIPMLVGFVLNHMSYQLTIECHLLNIQHWNHKFAQDMAHIDDFVLQEMHWTAIKFTHHYFLENGICPSLKIIKQSLGSQYSRDRLIDMFPLGFGWQLLRYAGIPRPMEVYVG